MDIWYYTIKYICSYKYVARTAHFEEKYESISKLESCIHMKQFFETGAVSSTDIEFAKLNEILNT